MEKALKRIGDTLDSILQGFYIRFIDPIRKARRASRKAKRRAIIIQAKGEILETFEPFLMSVYNEAVRDYEQARTQRTHYHNEATSELRKFFEIKIKSFISGNE